jgi:NADPH-dependent curcumin reductase CurA
MKGLVVYDHMNRMDEMTRVVSGWIHEDRFRYREDVVVGLDNAPEAFCALMQGRNFGKSLVKVA